MTITVSTTDPRSLKALAIAADAGQWLKMRTLEGHRYYGIRSQANSTTVYFVDCQSRTCQDRKRHGGPCKHQLAVQLHCARVNGNARKPRRRKSIPTGVGVVTGAIRELRLQGPTDLNPPEAAGGGICCSTCGQVHADRDEQRRTHMALADAIWGVDGN